MKPINQSAKKVMDNITGKLNGKDHLKIDNTDGAFMPVVVEKDIFLDGKYAGQVFSVAHYYEQNGDLMSDPFMRFLKADADGNYYPICFEQHGPLARYDDVFVYNDETGEILGYRPRMQRDLTVFANMWMRNIKWQQGL